MRLSVRSAAVSCIVSLLASAPLQAQGAEFSLGGGLAVPLGTYDDIAKVGWQGTAALSFLSRSAFGARIDGMYARFSTETADDIQSQLIHGTANVVYRFQGSRTTRLRPYLIGGGGIYNLKAVGDDAPEGSSTDLGINLGAGFDIGAGGARLFMEARWHNVFLEGGNIKFLPITLGIRFGG